MACSVAASACARLRARLHTGAFACVLAGAVVLGLMGPRTAHAADLTIAAASDLRDALDAVVSDFRRAHGSARIDVVYGSSGKLSTQIRHGAPFDVFLSADIAYPRALQADGLTAGPVRPYAVGRLVLWSRDPALGRLTLDALRQHPAVRRFAIPNPRHAPYGQRAEEALKAAGVWDALQPRLVLGDNVAQTAQFVASGAADAGLVALSLVLAPSAQGVGAWTLIPADRHSVLEQGHVVLKRAAANALAAAFIDALDAPLARAVFARYGFTPP